MCLFGGRFRLAHVFFFFFFLYTRSRLVKELTLITQKDKPTHKTHNTQHRERWTHHMGRDNMERRHGQHGDRGGRTHTQYLRAGTSRDLREGKGFEGGGSHGKGGGGGRGIKHMEAARTSRKEFGISNKVDLG